MTVLKRRSRWSTLLTAVGLLSLTLLVPTALGGGAPSIAFHPSSEDYGTIDPGTSTSQTLTLTNSGGSATGALAVSLTGSPAFSKTADTCTASLGPKKSCSVTVQYAPTTAGSSDTGTLTVMSNKSSAVTTASLTGASTSQPQVDCESYGGTFSTDPTTDQLGATGTVLWTCNGANQSLASLAGDCFQTEGGDSYIYRGFAPFDSTCEHNGGRLP